MLMTEFSSSTSTASIPLKVISGGQTGVDQAALEAALHLNITIGGFCPRDRRCESGRIPLHYPLIETGSNRYKERTLKNILASDGTLILYTETPLKGGTQLTRDLAQKYSKPCLCLSLQDPLAPQTYMTWIREHPIQILNVAGPRESHSPGIGREARKCLLQIWQFSTTQGEKNTPERKFDA